MDTSKIHHVSKEDMARWNSINTEEGDNFRTATSLEDIGLDNTATLEEVLTRLREEEDTHKWNKLSIGIQASMGLEPSMPLRGTGHLVIERHSTTPSGRFYMNYRGNISANTADTIRVFIANQQNNLDIPNERTWREIRTTRTLIGTNDIANLGVTGDKIANGTITGDKLVDGTVGQTQLANDSVGTNQLVNLGVTGDKIANGTITADKIAPNANLGGGIRSIQRGTVVVNWQTVNALWTVASMSISPVNLSRSFLVTNVVTYSSFVDERVLSYYTTSLDSSSSISVTRGSGTGSNSMSMNVNIKIAWQVIEFN